MLPLKQTAPDPAPMSPLHVSFHIWSEYNQQKTLNETV